MSSSAYWDKIAQKYAKQPVPDEAVYQEKLRLTQEYLEPHSRVLELACGTGTTALHHAAKAQHIRAVDISHNMIAIAKQKQQSMGIDNVSFECVAIEELEFEAESYNMVMAHSILHLVANQEPVIATIFQALKPGGVFVTSSICLKSTYAWLKPIAGLMNRLGIWPELSFFSHDRLIENIETQGLSIVQKWQPKKRSPLFIVAIKQEK